METKEVERLSLELEKHLKMIQQLISQQVQIPTTPSTSPSRTQIQLNNTGGDVMGIEFQSHSHSHSHQLHYSHSHNNDIIVICDTNYINYNYTNPNTVLEAPSE